MPSKQFADIQARGGQVGTASLFKEPFYWPVKVQENLRPGEHMVGSASTAVQRLNNEIIFE